MSAERRMRRANALAALSLLDSDAQRRLLAEAERQIEAADDLLEDWEAIGKRLIELLGRS